MKIVRSSNNILPMLLLCVVALASFHCGVTQPVRVLEDGKTQITASLGGPFVPMGNSAIPVPYLNLGLVHGYSGNTTLCSNLHVLPLLFGVVGIDAGAATRLVKQEALVPEVTAKGLVMAFSDFRGGMHPRIYPQISINASYDVWNSSLAYIGADNVYQIGEPHYLLSPFVGFQFPLGRQWSMQVESKWQAANINTAHGIYEGQPSISHYGNTSIYIGFQVGL